MTRTERFLSRLRAGQVLLADGATGTRLQSQGLEAGRAPEVWVVEQPQRVRDLHQGYVDAGSDILLTCTFGGTRVRLEKDSLAGRVGEVNRTAAELAREVAAAAQAAKGREIWVGGDMGPTGALLAPLGPLSAEEVTAAYAVGSSDFIEIINHVPKLEYPAVDLFRYAFLKIDLHVSGISRSLWRSLGN